MFKNFLKKIDKWHNFAPLSGLWPTSIKQQIYTHNSKKMFNGQNIRLS